IACAHSCRLDARRGEPSLPQARKTAALLASAKSAGVGQREIQSCHCGATRATGVCWLMTSLIKTPQAEVFLSRHGRGLSLRSNQVKSAEVSIMITAIVLVGSKVSTCDGTNDEYEPAKRLECLERGQPAVC